MGFDVSSFYLLRPLDDLEGRRQRLLAMPGLLGLLILSSEGVNGTVAGDVAAVEAEVASWPGFGDILFKRSQSDIQPFGRWKVVIRRQAVTAGQWTPVAPPPPDSYLTPAQWHERLGSAVLLDVRNDYEIRVGSFPGAVDPGTTNFTELAEFVQGWDLPRDTPVMTFCTGGIRCEKAVPLLRAAGFAQVHQLHGGILEYFREFPDGGKFQGECFVFDDRVALDSRLRPCPQWTRCASCGDPIPVGTACPDCPGAAE